MRGDPEKGTENGEVRRVPMIAEMRQLLEKLRHDRPDEPAATQGELAAHPSFSQPPLDDERVFAVQILRMFERATQQTNVIKAQWQGLGNNLRRETCAGQMAALPTASKNNEQAIAWVENAFTS